MQYRVMQVTATGAVPATVPMNQLAAVRERRALWDANPDDEFFVEEVND